jgi:hypothetical protein
MAQRQKASHCSNLFTRCDNTITGTITYTGFPALMLTNRYNATGSRSFTQPAQRFHLRLPVRCGRTPYHLQGIVQQRQPEHSEWL